MKCSRRSKLGPKLPLVYTPMSYSRIDCATSRAAFAVADFKDVERAVLADVQDLEA